MTNEQYSAITHFDLYPYENSTHIFAGTTLGRDDPKFDKDVSPKIIYDTLFKLLVKHDQ